MPTFGWFVVNLYVNSTSPIDPMWKSNNDGEKNKNTFFHGYIPVTTPSFQDAKKTKERFYNWPLTLQ